MLRMLRWAFRLVLLLVVVAFVYLVVTSVQVVEASRSPLTVSQTRPAGAIVVIDSPGDAALGCQLATALFRSHHADLVFTTGSGTPSVAARAASCLRAAGVKPITAVALSEVPAQLGAVASMLPVSAHGQVILVADPLETKWLQGVATAEHLRAQVAGVPVPKGAFWGDFGTIWRQTVAVALGRVIGFENTGWIGS